MGDLWSARFFFLATWWAGHFFPSKCSAGYFSPPHFSAVFFSSKRVTCLHIQNVPTFIAVFFFKTGSTKVLSFLRLFSKGHNIEATH